MRYSNEYSRPWPGGLNGTMHIDLDLHFQGQNANYPTPTTPSVRSFVLRLRLRYFCLLGVRTRIPAIEKPLLRPKRKSHFPLWRRIHWSEGSVVFRGHGDRRAGSRDVAILTLSFILFPLGGAENKIFEPDFLENGRG
jgi:hypothetical protein